MHELRYRMPLELMERITPQHLCDHLDEILERVSKEDIGFVILGEDGKDKNVLCPARWFEIYFDDDFGCIINSALRYSIRRESYMPGVVVRFIRKYLPVLDLKTVTVAIRDIENEMRLGGLNEPEMWEKLKEELLLQQASLCEDESEQKEKKQ